MSAWLAMWSYRVNQRLTPNRPRWLHLLMCTHCHGIKKWCRQQVRERNAA